MTGKKKEAPPPERYIAAKAVFRWIVNDLPVFAIVAISFTGSYFHIIELAEKYGQHGIEAMATAGVVDLFCYVMAMERQRDKSIGRAPSGPLSLPAAFLVLGVFATLTINLATADPGAWGYVIAAIPPAGLILAIVILERRKSFVPAGEEKPRNQRRTRNPVPGSGSAPVPGAGLPAGSASGSAEAPLPVPAAGTQGPAAARRSVEQLNEEGRRIEAETGERLSVKALRVALRCNYQDARAAARLMHPEDYADADEESEAEGQ